MQTECGLGEAQNVGLAATEAARPAHGPAPGGDEPAQVKRHMMTLRLSVTISDDVTTSDDSELTSVF